MARFLVWLNTFEREDLLQRLLDNIRIQQKDHIVDVFVFKDDGGSDYEDIKRDPIVKLFYTSNQRCGRMYYWKLINEGLSYIEKYQNDYDVFIKTDDDMELCDGFFDICLNYWKVLKQYSPKTFSLDILSAPRQRGKTLRGDKLPLVEKARGIGFYRTQWVDMNFIFDIKVFQDIKFKITDCMSGPRSSGVGLWLTRTFNSLGYEMYQLPVSLLIHKDHHSWMNEETRTNTPIVTKGLE